jgi:uncharacterized protein (TIRG00374 family)
MRGILRRRVVLIAAKATVSLVLIGLLLRSVDIEKALEMAGKIPVFDWGMAWVLVGLAYLLGGVRWWLCLRVRGFPHKMRRVIHYRNVGQGLNILVPGGVVGDLLQVSAVARAPELPVSRALGTVVADRLFGLVGLVLTGVVVFPLANMRTHEIDGMVSLAVGSLLAVGVAGGLFVVAIMLLSRRSLQGKTGLIVAGAANIVSVLAAYRHNLVTVLLVVALGITSSVALAVSLKLLVETLGSIPLSVAYMAIVIATLASLIPFTYGGAGVREIAFVAFFVESGMMTAEATVAALAWLVLTFLVAGCMTLFGVVLSDFEFGPAWQQTTDKV